MAWASLRKKSLIQLSSVRSRALRAAQIPHTHKVRCGQHLCIIQVYNTLDPRLLRGKARQRLERAQRLGRARPPLGLEQEHAVQQLGEHAPLVRRRVERGVGDERAQRLVGQVEDERGLVRLCRRGDQEESEERNGRVRWSGQSGRTASAIARSLTPWLPSPLVKKEMVPEPSRACAAARRGGGAARRVGGCQGGDAGPRRRR